MCARERERETWREGQREINNLAESMLIGREAAGFRVSRAGVRKLRYIKDMATELTFTAFIDKLCSIPTDEKVQPLPP